MEKEKAVSHQKRYYHQDCLRLKQSETQHRKELIEYICVLYKIEIPTGMILKQIKNFTEEYKYKYKGIELALRYFYETLDNKPRQGDGIGIVPYVYDDAKRHYIKKMAILESAQNEENHIVEERVVYIKPNINKKSKMIDITSIL
jgi:hypothetical protein